jgi:hypothetical protein
MAKELFEIKRNQEGYGYLIERDAGYISLDDPRNVKAINELNSGFGDTESGVKIVDRLKVFAVFQKYGIENANGRIYPEQILKKQVDIYQEKINDRRSYGELNHPDSVTIDGDRLAFGITKLWWEGHTLVGEIELILSPGFVKYGVISCVGDKVANYLRLDWKIGVSSRGLGSVEKDRFSGKYIVQDDFEITCWDIVTDPSTPGSYIGAQMNDLTQYVENKVSDKNKIIEGLNKFLNKKILI